MAITQIIATLPAVLNDSATFYEDIAERNNSLVTTVLPSINTWSIQANDLAVEVNDKAAQVAAQAVDGGYSQTYINTNFVGVNNDQDITAVKTFIVSPIVPTPTAATQATNKDYVDNKPSGFKNLIINGKKAINQRGLTSTDNSYNQDRWYKSGVNWYQGIEGNNNLISGKTYTLSWVGTATASYYVGTATSATINAQSFTSIINGGSFTLTITLGQNLWIKFASDATGSTFNFVQIEEGSVATPFEQRPIGLELSLCKRYYETIGALFNITNVTLKFQTEKRVIPTTIITSSYGQESATISQVGVTMNEIMLTATNGSVGVSLKVSAEL